jgi:hypothetical protein
MDVVLEALGGRGLDVVAELEVAGQAGVGRRGGSGWSLRAALLGGRRGGAQEDGGGAEQTNRERALHVSIPFTVMSTA